MDSNVFLLLIIGCNVVFSLKGFSDFNFMRENEFHVGSIRAGQKSRMISSAFLHADVGHLLFNMIALYSFGPVVIQFFGNFTFILIYFGSLISGSLLTLIMHKNDLNYSAVGASGAIMGIIYSAILVYPDMEIGVYFVLPIKGYIFGILYLLYSIYGMKAKNDNIGHTAHFGGAIGGYAITLLKAPMLIQENTFVVVLLAIPIVILFLMDRMGKV